MQRAKLDEARLAEKRAKFVRTHATKIRDHTMTQVELNELSKADYAVFSEYCRTVINRKYDSDIDMSKVKCKHCLFTAIFGDGEITDDEVGKCRR
jgi:hypothetical protein